MLTPPVTILLVDDDHLIRLGIKRSLEALGYRVVGLASTGPQAVTLAVQHQPTHVLMDVRLKGTMDGVDTAAEILTRQPCRIIFVTGSNEPDTLERIRTVPSDGVLIKPILPAEIANVIGPPGGS
jgi:CheY-like chemotaxis protein